MKKRYWISAVLLLLLTLAACGSPNAEIPALSSKVPDSLQTGSKNTETETQLPDPSAESSAGKTLVVYFSATGNTEKAAAYIASATGGDLFELIPEEPYSREDLNWSDPNSRVAYEHDHPDERAVALSSATVDGFDAYDTVFIGYPIWWGIAAWPVNGFIEANDFTGKTVIPFCTSASSGLGQSGKLLSDLAGTGNWLEGVRFSSGVSEAKIAEWLQSLGY